MQRINEYGGVGLFPALGLYKDCRVGDINRLGEFRPILIDMYRDNKETGGQPHNNKILMIKMLVLAGWHGLSDYKVELLATEPVIISAFSRVSGKNTRSLDCMAIPGESDGKRKDPSYLG